MPGALPPMMVMSPLNKARNGRLAHSTYERAELGVKLFPPRSRVNGLRIIELGVSSVSEIKGELKIFLFIFTSSLGVHSLGWCLALFLGVIVYSTVGSLFGQGLE